MSAKNIRFEKVLDNLPVTLLPDTQYFIKDSTTGKVTQYMTDSLGLAAVQVSGKDQSYNDLTDAPVIPSSPTDLGLGNVDNTSDLTKPISTATQTALNLKLDTAKVGAANGAADLDANAKIPSSRLPDSLLGQLSYQGMYDMAVALPTATAANKGWYYIASTEANGYKVGDHAISNGTSWDKIDNTGGVQSVAGRVGVVLLNKSDVGLDNVDNTTDLSKPISTATQTALDLKASKVELSSGLALKADKTTVSSELALKADKAAMVAGLALKADKTYVDSNLTLKANSSDVTTALDLKADKTTVTTDLALKADKSTVTTSLSLKLDASKVGIARGVADLDANSKVPSSRLPDSILGQLSYQGLHDMAIALPAASAANKGWYYIASNTAPSNGYNKGDHAISNGVTWDRIDTSGGVQSVAGRVGVIVLDKTDVSLDQVDNTADLDKPISTATQTALDLKANTATVTTDLALKADKTTVTTALNLKLDAIKVGMANGVAELDGDQKIPVSRLPNSVVGQMAYQGTRDMTTPLPLASSDNKGWVFVATNTTEINGYSKGDWAVSNGTSWDKIDNTDAVQSVAGKSGIITLDKSDVSLNNVDNTSDADKPISNATKTVLDTKVNMSYLTSQLLLKADVTTVTNGLALKVNNSDLTTALALKADFSSVGIANGICDLDINQKVPLSRLPDSLLGGLSYQGPYDMATALPTADTSNKGWYYIASNATPTNGYSKGDWAVSNGTSWDKIDNTSAVQSVAGRTGTITLSTADLSDFATAVGTPLGLKAPLASPTFTGTVTIPTATAGDNSTKAASTAFVTSALNDKAPLDSPTFTGTVTVPTMTTGDNTTAAASTAFVTSAIATKAPLASPTFTGTPAAPTAAVGTNTTQIATTAFVLANSLSSVDTALTGTPTAPTANAGTSTTQIATTAFVATGLAGKAPLASPTFTGTPAAPTPAAGTNTTQLATTAFVANGYAPLSIPMASKTAAYTLVAADKSTRISTTANITINKDVFAAGDSVVLCNANTSATAITITIGTGLTCYLDGNTTAKTSLTLAARGTAVIMFDSATVANILGKSLT